jgi:hypothetical protein
VKYVFKINSGYDGFTPARLPDRTTDGILRLGWDRYLDEVNPDDEVWVYFKGPHRFEPGVYARGRVRSIDRSARSVYLRLFEHAIDAPIVGGGVAERLAAIIAVPYLQVFPVPEELPFAPDCSIATTAESCGRRRCDACSVWPTLQRIDAADVKPPSRVPPGLTAFVPAYWVVPPRSIASGRQTPAVRKTTELFMRFKTGQKRLAFPLALGMYTCLKARNFPRVDALVPIPLSPDKEARGELNRTLALAKELELLMDVPVKALLRLVGPISKTALKVSAYHFEMRYSSLLAVDPAVATLSLGRRRQYPREHCPVRVPSAQGH